jgi:hypothetical protein
VSAARTHGQRLVHHQRGRRVARAAASEPQEALEGGQRPARHSRVPGIIACPGVSAHTFSVRDPSRTTGGVLLSGWRTFAFRAARWAAGLAARRSCRVY